MWAYRGSEGSPGSRWLSFTGSTACVCLFETIIPSLRQSLGTLFFRVREVWQEQSPNRFLTLHGISEQMSSRSSGKTAMSSSCDLEGYTRRGIYRNKTVPALRPGQTFCKFLSLSNCGQIKIRFSSYFDFSRKNGPQVEGLSEEVFSIVFQTRRGRQVNLRCFQIICVYIDQCTGKNNKNTHRPKEFRDHRRKFSQTVGDETAVLETLLDLILKSRKE